MEDSIGKSEKAAAEGMVEGVLAGKDVLGFEEGEIGKGSCARWKNKANIDPKAVRDSWQSMLVIGHGSYISTLQSRVLQRNGDFVTRGLEGGRE